jgi:hypothetical protein
VINLDPTFGQEFFHVLIRQAITPVPADRLQDHLRWEPKASKRRSIKQRRNNPTMAHPNSPADQARDPSMRVPCWLCRAYSMRSRAGAADRADA